MNSTVPYYIWRLGYIGIKPAAVLLTGTLLGSGVANIISFSILVSSLLMASLSFGTYRGILKSKDKPLRREYFYNFRKGVFVTNCLFLCALASVASFIFSWQEALFALMFILNEHVLHDEARLHLYNGDRERWARHNFVRSLFIPALPVAAYLLGGGTQNTLLMAIASYTVAHACFSVKTNGLLRLNALNFLQVFSRKFVQRYLSNTNYFISSFISKAVQQSDRVIFALLNYEQFWVYTLVAQIANIPLMFYELSYLSRFKSKVAQIKNQRFKFVEQRELIILAGTSAFAVALYAITAMHVVELNAKNFMILVGIILLANMISAICMTNNERLFWQIDNPGMFNKLELRALIVGHGLAVPLVLLTNNFYLVKLPNIFNNCLRIVNSWRHLKS